MFCPLCASFRARARSRHFLAGLLARKTISAREVATDCCKAQIGSQQRQGF